MAYFTFTILALVSLISLSQAASLRLDKRAVTNPGPPGWTSLGCYTDTGARTLSQTMQTTGGAANMTVAICLTACNSYQYAGVEYGGECYCGIAIQNGGAPATDGRCNMPCNGNSSEYCGGSWGLNLYQASSSLATSSSSSAAASSTSASASAATATGWVSAGCYNDTVGRRTLAYEQYGLPSMTVEICTAACKAGGYKIAGVEYAGECYCDNVFENYGQPASDGNAGCNMACAGNANETCGGSNRLNIYTYGAAASSSTASVSSASSTASSSSASASTSTLSGWSYKGCYNDSVGARTLSQAQYGLGSMTVELCEGRCQSLGYTYAGVEYSGECYCDNTFQNYGAPASDGSAGCNMACAGNANETCGGSNRLSVYQFGSASSSSSSSSASVTSGTSSASSSTASSASSTSSSASIPTGWAYQGCYIDNANGRIFANQQPDNSALTIESCISTCSGLGYSVAGMEYSVQCFCDNFVRNGGTLAASNSSCAMTCGGNTNEICGGPNLLTVYAKGNLQVYQPPAAQKTGLPGNWSYAGCLSDAAGAAPRTFPYQLTLSQNNTAQACLTQCAMFGYSAAGMEYGDECWCGDTYNIPLANNGAGATLIPESSCNMACSGNASYLCGGSNALSFYIWNSTTNPLYQWTYASGINAGSYEFLIGGVVVPLVTSTAVNGKVTFLEKFGTGPPNSTGAYELDLSLINNFTLAWRPMHVKSDVFCSASLTLPDKAGRQINVGGWANQATYGIRLYWPDGSPGVWGTNDWQENYSEIHLQQGRWYPTAMIMANGSILVVGGEEGSNGAPVPTLEVLPTVGPYLYMDWLQRTDPYNLYPYLVVLPGGGIFVAYYNEARILDEKTFATTKVLPNIPGAVNDFLGGRTYPFEGTAVILPQTYPYSDPLTVLICGGSVPGPEIALDNCVSIQPEVPNANWTIERMPSKRVESSMAALPDGTYLIANGAHQGRAGFGTSSDPNLNALLYDPSKPLNRRITMMANTTIGRLYHNELALLMDGRVLVSGSDPEDNIYPQEYRVEVFNPPYILSGAARPTFTLNNVTDWTYNQVVTITLTSPIYTGNLRVSLLGATASTHGNTMGQRTFFPKVVWTANSTTLTVTAPPNAHVCPPGWFMVHVLDGPTPSVAQWVRIGGDPGGLGNWPNLPDFQPLPGS